MTRPNRRSSGFPRSTVAATRTQRSSISSGRSGGVPSRPWLPDAGHLITTMLIFLIACVLAVRLMRLPWAGYEDFESALRTLGLISGVLAAMAAAWRFSSHDPRSMLMTPSGKKGIATRYGYIAMANAVSALSPLVVGAIVLLLPLLGQNSLRWQFIFPPLTSVVGFVIGSTAVGIVIAEVARSIPLIARIAVSGGISLLFGGYTGTFGFLWPLGVKRYSGFVDSSEKMWAAGLSLLLATIALLGAVVLTSRSADPFSPVKAFSVMPFAAAAFGLTIGIATSSLPVNKPQLLCDTTSDPNISVCVNSAKQPALQHSIDSANQALTVVGSLIPDEKVVYTPTFGKTVDLGREINYQPWQHRTNLGNNIIESVVSTANCNGDERPEAAYLNLALNSHLLATANLQRQAGLARDASGRITRGESTEGGSLHKHSGDPFASTPLDVIITAIASHPVEIAECNGQWEWFGVTPQ